jgi:hypothetical protein
MLIVRLVCVDTRELQIFRPSLEAARYRFACSSVSHYKLVIVIALRSHKMQIWVTSLLLLFRPISALQILEVRNLFF